MTSPPTALRQRPLATTASRRRPVILARAGNLPNSKALEPVMPRPVSTLIQRPRVSWASCCFSGSGSWISGKPLVCGAGREIFAEWSLASSDAWPGSSTPLTTTDSAIALGNALCIPEVRPSCCRRRCRQPARRCGVSDHLEASGPSPSQPRSSVSVGSALAVSGTKPERTAPVSFEVPAHVAALDTERIRTMPGSYRKLRKSPREAGRCGEGLRSRQCRRLYRGAVGPVGTAEVSITARDSNLNAIRDDGLLLESPHGDVHVHPVASAGPCDVGLVGVVILPTKTTDVPVSAMWYRLMFGGSP